MSKKVLGYPGENIFCSGGAQIFNSYSFAMWFYSEEKKHGCRKSARFSGDVFGRSVGQLGSLGGVYNTQ